MKMLSAFTSELKVTRVPPSAATRSSDPTTDIPATLLATTRRRSVTASRTVVSAVTCCPITSNTARPVEPATVGGGEVRSEETMPVCQSGRLVGSDRKA
jgi:hypothetical protein